MPQPKRRTSSSKRSGSSKSGGRAATKSQSTAKRSTGAKKSTAKRSTGKRSTSAKRSTAARSRPTTPEEIIRGNIADLREALTKGLGAPLHLMMLTRERVQEAFDDAVERGRITRTDANDLAAEIVSRGRRQTEDVLADLEQLLGRGQGLRTRAEKAGRGSADRVLREVDRARRASGVGGSFPILGYDDLSAGQVTSRLTDLTPAQLRKVRDYERRHGNRKSVLSAIEKKLD